MRWFCKKGGQEVRVWKSFATFVPSDGVVASTQCVFGPVAQLNRASDSGSEGRGFESLLGHDGATDVVQTKRTELTNLQYSKYMKGITYLGILVEVIGAAILIYLGFAGTGQTNTGLVIGLVLVLVGFLLHIFLDKKYNSLPEENQ